MVKKHYSIVWCGYTTMTLSSLEDAQEMILALAESSMYEDFCGFMNVDCQSQANDYVNYIAYCRDEENRMADEWGGPAFETWYGYGLLRRSDDYTIGNMVHLD